MTQKAHQEIIIDSLASLLDISDVYFHKGVLYVVNEYDAEKVEDYLKNAGFFPDIEYKVVECQ